MLKRTSVEMSDAEEAAVRAARRRDYRDVEDRGRDGLFVGNVKIEASYRDMLYYSENPGIRRRHLRTGTLPPSVMEALDVYYSECLHECGCGRKFIAHYTLRLCRTCREARRAKARDAFAAYTADRAAKRAEARPKACARCGQPMTTQRSTKRYCSDACRNAAR
jgi:hypothetical protein